MRPGRAGSSACSSPTSPKATSTWTCSATPSSGWALPEYLETSYYEHWLHVYETVLVERGILTKAEIEEKIASLRQAGED